LKKKYLTKGNEAMEKPTLERGRRARVRAKESRSKRVGPTKKRRGRKGNHENVEKKRKFQKRGQ